MLIKKSSLVTPVFFLFGNSVSKPDALPNDSMEVYRSPVGKFQSVATIKLLLYIFIWM